MPNKIDFKQLRLRLEEFTIMVNDLEEQSNQPTISEELLEEVVDGICHRLNEEGIYLVDDYDLELNRNEIEMSSIEYNTDKIYEIVEDVLNENFDIKTNKKK